MKRLLLVLLGCFVFVANFLTEPVKWEGCSNCLPELTDAQRKNHLPEYEEQKNPLAKTGDRYHDSESSF